jgi:hypothetical protein
MCFAAQRRTFLEALELPADSFEIVLGLLLRVLCGLLGIGIRLQLMDGPAQALRFLCQRERLE